MRTTMDQIDLEKLRLEGKVIKKSSTHGTRRPPQHKPNNKFLKGPIPWTWLTRAARQSGKTLHVAIALWFMAGITRSREIKLTSILLGTLGVSRFSKRWALMALEKANLISVNRNKGKNPVITLLEPPDNELD